MRVRPVIIYIVSKKQLSVYVTVVDVDRFLQYLAQNILRKFATQKLLICPPHLHNAVALPWENNF